MKICAKCKESKDDSSFSFRNKSKNQLQSRCKDCKKEDDKKDYQKESRKISIRKALKNSQNKLKEFISNYKKEQCCAKCGDIRHYVLDFHHLKDKSYNISEGVRRGISINTLKKEINKCIMLCSNCHRELHYLDNLL